MKASKFLKAHPMCCFCGGAEPATSIEHQPARIIFPSKHRPKGMEFPSCDGCNKQTSVDDSILAVVARIAGSMRPDNRGLLDNAFNRAVGGIKKHYPAFKFAGHPVWTRENGVLVRTGGIDVNQPLIHQSLCRLAAKIALATHYSVLGSVADERHIVNTMWVHNQHPSATEVADILKMFPNSHALQQGRWDTSDSFFVRHAIEDGSLLVAAVFYETVLLYAQIGPEEVADSWTMMQAVWRPEATKGIQKLQ